MVPFTINGRLDGCTDVRDTDLIEREVEVERRCGVSEMLEGEAPVEDVGWGTGAMVGGDLVGQVCGVLVDEAEQG